MFCASFSEKLFGIIKEKEHLNWMDEISISFSITYFWDISFLFYFWCFDKNLLQPDVMKNEAITVWH